MNLKTVGYYKEMPHGRENDPSIYDFINKESEENAKAICEYLSHGMELICSPGVVDDVIQPEKGRAGVSSSYTDGKWLWPGDLSYYVSKYKLLLPEEFKKDIMASTGIPLIDFDERDFDQIIIDGKDMMEES